MAFDFPASPATGAVQSGPNGAQWRWDGAKWVGNATWQGATVTVSDTPPANPASGALWWCSADGNLYTYFQDVNSAAWVISNSGGIPEAPTDSGVYARTNAQWANIATATAAAPNNTGRSFIHNGTFVIAQRGSGPWTTSVYTADRWNAGVVTDTASFSLATLSDAARAQIGDESATTYLANTFTGNAAGTAQTYIEQRIENMRRLAGKTVTVSMWVTSSNAALRLGVNIYQNTGTGGSPSGGGWALATGNSVATTTSWARVSTTIAIPSAAGATLGTNGDNSTILRLFYSSGATNNAVAGNIGVQSGTINVWGVQLEYGSVATPLAKRDPVDELQLCQRFFEVLTDRVVGSSCQNGYSVRAAWFFKVRKRAVPTISFQTGQGSSFDYVTVDQAQAYNNTSNAYVDLGAGTTASADL